MTLELFRTLTPWMTFLPYLFLESLACLDYTKRMSVGNAFIAETIYIRKNHHYMLYGFIFEWGECLGEFQYLRINFLLIVFLSRIYPILYLENLFLNFPSLALQSGFHTLFLMRNINLKNILRNIGMADSCRVLDVEENLLDKDDYHLSFFSPDDLETLWSYQGFHNDSLKFKSPEEYSYH